MGGGGTASPPTPARGRLAGRPPTGRRHPYAEPHRAGAQVATDRQDANGAPDLSGTPEKKGVRSCENHDVRPTIVRGS